MAESNRRILGIDPGLQITGYGCVDLCAGSAEPVVVEAGVLRLPTRRSMSFRLGQLFDDLSRLIGELNPQFVAVEQLFAHYKHARTSIIMGHARGVVLLAVERHGAQLEELNATEVKKALTGHGHATKQQMQLAVMGQFRLPQLPSPPDVADALAIAACAARRLSAAAMVGA